MSGLNPFQFKFGSDHPKVEVHIRHVGFKWGRARRIDCITVLGNIHGLNTFCFVLDASSGTFVPNMVMRAV